MPTDKAIYQINGIISRTVSSNNLIVALKNFDGADFSSLLPFVHKIGNTPRSLTGALSVTVNAGASTFNAGSVEFAAKEIDYFVYLGWRASTGSMFILISRIPYATVYGDFSVTATNEKYGAYSGAAPASTDPVVNIGRFNATNSGTASYNWSVPATSVIKNFPIYETRWLDWLPAYVGFTGAVTTVLAKYKIVGESECKIAARFSGTITGAPTTITFSAPFNGVHAANFGPVGACLWFDTANTGFGGISLSNASPNLLNVIKYNNGAFNNAAGVISGSGAYQI